MLLKTLCKRIVLSNSFPLLLPWVISFLGYREGERKQQRIPLTRRPAQTLFDIFLRLHHNLAVYPDLVLRRRQVIRRFLVIQRAAEFQPRFAAVEHLAALVAHLRVSRSAAELYQRPHPAPVITY